MKTKTKVVGLLIALALACSLLVVGVWAVVKTDFKVSGNITFKATGVEATISCTGFENGTLNNGTVGQDKLTDININTSMSKEDLLSTFSPWQSLKLSFGSDASDIQLSLRITNNNANPDNLISAEVTAEAGYSYNCEVVAVNSLDGTSNALIAPGNYADYVVTFSVPDSETNATLTDFVVNFNLKHTTVAEVPTATDYAETLTFTYDDTTMTASAFGVSTDIEGDIDIPDYIKVDSVAAADTTSTSSASIYKVSSIGDSAFSACAEIKSITIPKSVSSIGESAFSTCYRLVEIKNLSNLEITNASYGLTNGNNSDLRVYREGESNISQDANGFVFYYDESSDVYSLIDYSGETTGITLPNDFNGNAYKVRAYAFYKNETIINVIVPDSITAMGNHAFELAQNLVTANVPKLSSYIFSSCSSLTNVTIPNDITTIDQRAFVYCIKLSRITIPNSVRTIEDAAFGGCSALTSLTIPSNVSTIGTAAFGNCVALETLTISSSASLSTIGNYAFQNCLKLRTAPLSNNVRSIGVSAFAGCSALSNVTLPSNVTNIGAAAFTGSGLQSVSIQCAPFSLGDSIFAYCENLTTVTITGNLSTIVAYMFRGCIKLSSVTLPTSLRTIDSFAFCDCSSLTSIVIPANVTTINTNAFVNCNLSTVSIASSSIVSKCTSISSCGYLLNRATIVNVLSTINVGSSVYFYRWTANGIVTINGASYKSYKSSTIY